MLHPNDFRTIWELAHVWVGADPSISDPQNLSNAVIDKLQKPIWAYLREKIGLRRKNGIKVEGVTNLPRSAEVKERGVS